ncbi:transcriptional regulator [Rhodococcus sp. H36-A4]|uniref:sigma-54-dependent Fis family transcriptional regulator n=1 Tax=Rhodococcus sp. H36-A4 TaxID=3004353 RepID=UPI0022AF3072|nr:helix-turn-helix domain-containing protein [Rhodococcus sp. H36-A4]MCZ4077870.1 transcriptional regulator [Rhodococcus sp. H36-A4]
MENTVELVREQIAQSWNRARLSGLDPSDTLENFSVSEVDRRSRLLSAADPVLDRMDSVLRGSRYCVILADREAKLVDIRFGTDAVRTLVESTGTVVGRTFTENTSGTNSIATVYELRKPVSVRGEEHFMESMKMFSCYGYPIFHPITRRIEGVLDITFLEPDDNPLLEPMLGNAVSDIQDRLFEETRWSEQLLFGAFQRASARRRGAPAVAIADEMFLENTSAGTLLDAVDHAALRALTDDPMHRQGVVRSMTLSSGVRATVRWERPASGAGIVIEIDPLREGSCSRPAAPLIRAEKKRGATVSVSGEPGSGRTTVLSDLAADAKFFDAVDLVTRDTTEWMTLVGAALADPDGAVVIEHVHLLTPIIARSLYVQLESAAAWFALSSSPTSAASAEHRQLLTACSSTIELSPLRTRRHEIPGLVRTFLAQVPGGPDRRITAAAMTGLMGYDWPGNLTELRSEVTEVAATRSVGDITPRDLIRPTSGAPSTCLGTLDAAMREAIVRELERHGGNKRTTAEKLGISRTTLYKRMKDLGIVG